MTEQTAQEPNGSTEHTENGIEPNENLDAQASESGVQGSENRDEHKQSAQGRINQLYGKSKHLERELEAREARIAELEAANKPQAQTPTLESFDYDEDKYQSALIEHKAAEIVDSRFAQQEQTRVAEQQKVKQAELVGNFNKASEAYAAENPEFSRLQNEAYQAGIINAIPEGIQNAIAANPKGPKMLHALLQDPTKIDALVNSDPYTAGMHLANLESSVSVKTVSSAPQPIQTLGDGDAVSGTASASDLSKMTAEQYYAHRMKNK